MVVCTFCNETRRDILRVVGYKKSSGGSIIEKIHFTTGYYCRANDRICCVCSNNVLKFYEFKYNILKHCGLQNADLSPPNDIPTSKRTRTAPDQTPSPEVCQFLSGISVPRKQLFPCRNTCRSDRDDKESPAISDHDYANSSVNGKSTRTTSQILPVASTSKTVQLDDLKAELINDLTASLSTICKKGSTVLFEKNAVALMENESYFTSIIEEMDMNVPFLLELLTSLIGEAIGTKVATIATIYGMIMHSRNIQASAIQRMWTAAAIKCHADNKLLERLNKIHLTLSSESKRTVVKEFALVTEKGICKELQSGKDGKINGDNLDLHVKTNDVRMCNHDKDYHFFASDWTPFRLQEDDIPTAFLQQYQQRNEVSICKLLPSNSEINQFLKAVKVLIGREIITHCSSFKWMELVVPKHITHDLSDVMSRKSSSYVMPILLQNESRYEDCLNILETYQAEIVKWYNRAGRGDELKSLRVPIGGDQLTRVRFDGARCLKMGAHTAEERFANLEPMIVELFHVLMDFLEKLFKQFMKKDSGRQIGTLAHLKTVIHRSDVNLNVKSRFKAHEDFVLLTGKAYLLNSVMEHFAMDTLESTPTKNIPPENVDRIHKEHREKVFSEVMDGIMDKTCQPQSFEQLTTKQSVHLNVNEDIVKVPLDGTHANLSVTNQGKKVTLKIPKGLLEKDSPILLGAPGVSTVRIKKSDGDDLYNYVSHFLQYYLLILFFKDAIAEGNIFHINIALKMMIPCFYSYSPVSKYMTECIDYILKTEMLLSPKQSLQVRTSSLVNTKGGQGNNKPMDLQKENQVKELKELIKGLGANKTENSIVNVCSAATVINSVVANLDAQLRCKDITTSHQKRNYKDDLNALLQELGHIKPSRYTPGRKLDLYSKIKGNIYSNLESRKHLFEIALNDTIQRLQRNLHPNEDLDSEISDQEEI